MIITINFLTVTKNEGFGGCANDHCDTTIVLDEIRETDHYLHIFVGGDICKAVEHCCPGSVF